MEQVWTYKQNCGYIIPPGRLLAIGIGWAGQGQGRNNPDMQNVKDIGPLPCGLYTIGSPRDDARTGKYTLDLIPDKANEMFGRSDFRIHGVNPEHPATSSSGCIIQTRDVREQIWTSGVHRLQVIHGEVLAPGPAIQ